MEKPAKTKYPIHQLIKNRWSPVCYDNSRKIESEKIGSLFEAIRWAPSCFNEQPWHFIMATKDNPEEYDKLLSCLAEYNQLWVKNASLLMIAVTKLYFAQNQKPNRHAFHDIGLGLSNLSLQAEAMSLRLRFMAGFDVEKTQNIYHIPEGFEPVTAIAIGYEADPNQFESELQERDKAPRIRKPLSDFVFTNSWGNSHFSE